jgi:hypothetical protein
MRLTSRSRKTLDGLLDPNSKIITPTTTAMIGAMTTVTAATTIMIGVSRNRLADNAINAVKPAPKHNYEDAYSKVL